MLLFFLRKGQLRFPVLMTLLLFMGMMPNHAFGENGTSGGRSGWGTPLPKIKCYTCAGEASSDCGTGKNQGDQVDCEGVCSTTTGFPKKGYVTKSCSKMVTSAEGLKCFKEVYDGLCSEFDGRNTNLFFNKYEKFEKCVQFKHGGDEKVLDGVPKTTCLCESNLCNDITAKAKADHSSPNKKLIFAVCMTVIVYCLQALV